MSGERLQDHWSSGFAVVTLKVEQDGFSLEKFIQKLHRELQTV